MATNGHQNLIEKDNMEEIKENNAALASNEGQELPLEKNSEEADRTNDAKLQKIENILRTYFRENKPADDALIALQKENLADDIDPQIIETKYMEFGEAAFKNADPNKISLFNKDNNEYIRITEGARSIYLNKTTKEIALNLDDEQKGTGNVFSVYDMINDGKDQSEYNALFKIIAQHIKDHVVLKHEHDYYVLAAYVVLTYSYNLFTMIPYLKIKGGKGSGKTTVLRTLKNIVKNPQFVSNLTTASLVRLGDDEEYTLLLDEAEMLKKRKGANEEIFEILNSGYQKDGKVIRVSGKENVEYKTYSPKVIASIKDLAETTEDRCIIIETDQNNEKSLKDPDLSKEKASGIKRLIQEIVINKSSEINGNIMKEAKYGDIELKNRDKDRWNPLFVLAMTITGAKNRILAELSGAVNNEKSIKEEAKRKSPEEYNISLIREIPEDTIIDEAHERYTVCDADKIAKFFIQMDLNGEFRTKTGVTQFLKRQGVEVDRQRIEGRLTALYKIPNALR